MNPNNIRILLSCIVSLITLIKLIFDFFKKNKCIPCCTLMTKQFISSDCQRFNNLNITYDGNNINRFTVTTFVFWNKGKTKLLKENYGKAIPYICCNNNCNIIDYNIREIHDNDFVNLKENFKDNKLFLEFDAISKNQGFVINLLHTGESNKDITYNFKFNEIKCKRIYLINKKRKGIFDALSSTLMWISALILIILFLLAGILSNGNLNYILILSISTLLTLIGTILNIRELYIPYMGVPKSFQKYFDEIDF